MLSFRATSEGLKQKSQMGSSVSNLTPDDQTKFVHIVQPNNIRAVAIRLRALNVKYERKLPLCSLQILQ